MGKDIKRKFTVSLDIDTKDAEKQIQSTVGNIKHILADMGNASDKMGYFKELVNYIQQVDHALTAFKQKNHGAFDDMFDGLDTNLKEVLANIFNTSGKSTTALDDLRNKINNAAASGAGVKELRGIAKEINALFAELGQAAPINIDKDFSGHGKIEDRIRILTDGLNNFAIVWSDVNKKISEGFNFGGTGSGAGIDGIVRDLGDKTNKAVNELESAKKLVEKAVKDFYDALIADADDTAKLDSIKRSLQKALSFDDVKFEDIADTFADLEFGDIEEDEAIKKITDAVTKIKNAKQDLNNTLQKKDTKSSGTPTDIDQSVTAGTFRENANETVDVIEYAKKVIVGAYKDYFNAVEKAKNNGFNVEYGDSSQEMDDIKQSIDDMLDKWGIKKAIKGKYDPKTDLDLSEFISDGDIGLDDIDKEIDKIFKQNDISFNASIDEMIADTAKLQNSTSNFANTTQKKSQEISSDLINVENKTQNVTSAFQELISYISQSGTTPKAFFDSLESGAEDVNGDLKNILATLNLIGSDGSTNFTSIKNGFTHQGGMVSDNYTLIARDEKYAKYAFESQPKLLAAKSMGANVGAIVDIYKDEVNGLVYELQNTVKGKGILDFKNSIVNTEFLDATDEQIKKLIQDLQILQKTGLYVDWGGDNILYDKNEGFSFIDLASKATHFTASEENSVHENINKFFETALNLDPMSLNTSFMQNVSKLTDEVINEANGIQKINEQQDKMQNNSAASAVVIKNEESAHEQNAQAINEENKALKAQIELKKQAQSMTWEKFALDESSMDLKSTAGLQTIGDMEKFWKQANYDKKIDFYELSKEDTESIIDANLDAELRKKWYVDQDFSVKPQIENAILANDALRNAAINKLYQIYKKYIDSAIEFDEFLNSEIAVYRGDSGLPAVYGEEQLLSFSFKESTATSFSHDGWDPNASVVSTNIIPKETLGSVSDQLWFDNEAEVFVPASNTPYVDKVGQSFEEYYNNLSTEMQKEVDGKLVELEKQRIANLLGDDLAYKTKLATKNGHLRNIAQKDFSQGIIPNQIDESQYYGFDNNDFASIYNSLSEMQKKLVAYYSALQLENKYVKNFSSEDIGNTGILNAIMNDKTGVKQHVASLTGEARFKLFGDVTQDISSEIAAHKTNTQAIQDETKAQQELNNSKIAFEEVNYKLGNAVLSSDGDKMSELNSIWNGIGNVGKTVEDFSHVINDGYYVSGSTGELLNVADLMDAVTNFETKYGENLQYVKDYLDQVYQKYNEDINAFLSGKDVSFVSDNSDFDDELILDGFDLYKENYTTQDYANAYAKESAEAQKAIDEYAAFKQEYDGLISTINRAPIDIMFPGVPTDNEKANVLAIFEAIKEKQKEIANMPLLETEDDIKKVQTLQAEVVGLQNQLRGAEIPGAGSIDYKEAYGLSSYSDGFELKKIIDGFSLYPVADELYNQLLKKNDNMLNTVSTNFQDMTLFGDQDSYNEFLIQQAKSVQAQQAASQQQLQVEQEITAEKKKQTLIDDTESLDNSTIQTEITSLDSLLAKLAEVKTAIDNKTMAFKEEGAVVDQIVQQELLSLAKLAVAIDEVQAALNTINSTSVVDNIDTKKLIEDGSEKASVEIQTTGDTEALKNTYALDATLLTTNGILENILAAIKTDESNSSIVGPISDAVAELKNVASGIVEHQKAQQTDKSAASARIANNYGQLSSISANAVSSMGDEVQIKNMKALANGVVRVEGAVRDADGAWKGFVIDINEFNDAAINSISEQSAFAKALNESAEAVKKADSAAKEAGNQDEFAKSLSAQQSSFNTYRENLKDVSYLNDEIRDKLDKLAIELASVGDASGLNKWKDDFEELKDEIDTVQTVFDREESKKIKDFRGKVNAEFKTLDFTTTTSDPTKEQQEILDLRSKLLLQLEENNKRIEEGKHVELDAINATMDALRQKINIYRQENDLVNSGGQKYGATAVLNATAKYNSLKNMVDPGGEFSNSAVVKSAFAEYEAAYNRLLAKRRELSQVEGQLNDTQKAELKQLQTECNNYAKDIEKIINSSHKLASGGLESRLLGDDFEDDVTGRKNALKDFVKELYDVDVAADSFKNNFNECTFVVENADGTFTEMTATINSARTAIVSTAGDTKKATGAFEAFFNELKGKFKSLSQYLISSFSIHEVWQQLRKGVTYVREIDTASTELKKVTDETDEAYDQFLQDMSKTAGVVGSTVKDLTTMTAEWSRLGYTMAESAKLAESTAVLLNVSEFQDATTASEALISTMQAFQYTADESRHVVDILNEIGNNYAISSDGIATALQDSASALMEGGNNLEQATALVAAANKVVQDPNSVGSALRTISLRLRGTSVEILEEMGEETDGVVESVSKLQEKIKALTGVDILTDSGAYKDTYTILREIGAVWQDMESLDKSAALELMAGKNRANTLSAILNNMDDLEGAYESAMNASGSAAQELDTYMDSIQGHIDQFNNALQTLWMNLLDSDAIKWVVDLGTRMLKLVDTIGLIPTALAGVVFYFTAIKKHNPVTMFKDLNTSMSNYGRAINQIQSIQSLNGANGSPKMDAVAFNDQHIKAFGMAVEGLTQKQQVAALATAGLTKEQIAQAIGIKDITDANFQAALAEAQVTSAKTKHVAVSGALLLSNKKDLSVTLSQKAQNFLLKHSEEEITDELLRQGRAREGLSKRDVRDIKTKRALTQENIKHAASWKGLTSSIGQLIKQNPVMFITMLTTALTAIIDKIETATDRTEKLTEAYNELQSSISTIEGEINSLESELNTLQDRIDELNRKDSLSLVEAEELQKLKEQSAELEHQKDLQERLLKGKNQQNQVQSMSMINNLLATTTANQQKTAEVGKTIGNVAGGVVAALATVGMWIAALVEPTPAGEVGASAATPALLAKILAAVNSLSGAAKISITTAAAVTGSQVGGAIGGGISKTMAADSLIEWYESYENAIAEAEADAAEAQNKYLNDISDNNYKKWQKKVEAVNTLQTDLYNGLEEMQGYINNLEYNDETSTIIDGYNSLMAHIDVKNTGGNIDAQISSIESLRSEYERLSRGVDEHGNNVALTASEYARYQAIVAQVLGYNVGLTQSFDENGSVIRDAQGNLVAYNDALSETIRLLKEQQKQAVVDAIEGENGDNKPLWKAYKTAKKNFKAGLPVVDADMIGRYGFAGTGSAGNDIEKIIGVGYAWYEDFDQYVYDNAKAISQNLNTILDEAKNHLSDDDLASYKNYLEEVIEYANSDVLNNQFKQTLSIVPQLSDAYDDLSGAQLSFVNAYISSLEIADDLSKKEVEQIKDNIVGLVDVIGSNETAQELIDNMFALDASSMPIQTYKQSFNDLFSQLTSELDLSVKESTALQNQFLPDMTRMDAMVEKVKAKLADNSKGLVEHLNLEELTVAYKLLPELPDNITFEELRQKIQEQMPPIKLPVVATYSSLIDQTEQFNELVAQTSEITLDNTKVTQDYKDALIELGIPESELAECFDKTNDLVVSNAKELNKLVKSAKQNTVQNVQLARSQARLQYYDLYKKMSALISENGELTDSNKEIVLSYYQEMNALEQTIAKYSMLEAQLIGTNSAYDKFKTAQEVDSETDYIGGAEEMVLALGQALNTAELGTESAKASIMGLVPESVYADLDTVDEKMSAIYDYFKSGKLSQYFDIEYDDDGNIESVEMKLGNLRKFIEDGLTEGVFAGKDWEHFELSEDFIQSLKDSENPLQEFADRMDVTTDVAFAFLKTLQDHDIEWLGGDYATIFDQLIPPTIESEIFTVTEKIAGLNAELASGKITSQEYAKRFGELSGELSTLKTEATTTLFGEDGVSDKTPDQIKEMNVDDMDSYLDVQQKLVYATEDVRVASEDYLKIANEIKEAEDAGIEVTQEQTDAEQKAAKVLKEKEDALAKVADKLKDFEQPTVAVMQLLLDDIEAEIAAAGGKFDKAISENFDLDENGYYTIKAGINMTDLEAQYPGITRYVQLLNSRTQLTATVDPQQLESEVSKTQTAIQSIIDTLTDINLTLDQESVAKIGEELGKLFSPRNIVVGITSAAKGSWDDTWNWITGGTQANGTAHASGNWGLPSAEHNSLVGELGPELVVDPHSGRYYTVGDSGAEMVDLPKGAIIFNHQQTEGLLKNGYVTSRGKAYAEGNAHVTIWPNASSKTEWTGTGYSSWDDPTYDVADTLSDAADSISDAADEFREVFDWIEVRLEEINEKLDLWSARLENANNYSDKNSIIDQMLSINEKLYNNLLAGADKYYSHAQTLLAKIPNAYKDAAQDGTISIETFIGEVEEETLNAIKEYREWVQKGADATKQVEEVLTEIRDLAIQKIDNAEHSGAVRAAVEDSQTEKLQNAVDYDEERGLITDPNYYAAMMENSSNTIEYLTHSRDEMQKAFNEAVESGVIEVDSDVWYEELDKLYQIDAEIDEATMELEEFQNAINDIYWDSFDELINRFDYISEEAQGLIDLMDSADMVSKPDSENGWGADDVKWTDEGLATIGLHAQEMERAEEKAKAYGIAIDDLTAEYEAGHYSESEYYEKLNELTQGQYDAIEAAEEEKEAIVELNEQRVDAIKEGIEKEIDAYEELIEKKKEELDAEKDLYDFQKGVAEQQKSIADIQRKLAALSGDNSASAIAKRKQLEAELYEAQEALEETYYDRSIENQQTALDKELEDFTEQKETEMEKWDEWLENVEQVITESLGIVQANATEIGNTLTEKAQEYNLTVSDAVLNPWKDGAVAIDEYTSKFGDSVSSTTAQLETIRSMWQAIREETAAANAVADEYYNKDAAIASGPSVADINKENANYASATKKEPTTNTSNQNTSKPTQSTPQYTTYTVQSGDTLSGIALSKLGSASKWNDIYNLNKDIISNPNLIYPGQKLKLPKYAKGTLGVKKDQWALIDELGEELVLHAGANGKVEYLTQGSSVIPADLTERWTDLVMNPQEVLDRNRPQIAPSKSVVNNNMEIKIDASVGELIHVERLDGGDLGEINKLVGKAWDKKIQELNNAIKKFSR